ncbi:hypothetical protein BSKO_04334 [Bryopsis sp. KO-2023]|nr:hypothetical protein BSKO_04334 [Bryopsis sp. KO-2023]
MLQSNYSVKIHLDVKEADLQTLSLSQNLSQKKTLSQKVISCFFFQVSSNTQSLTAFSWQIHYVNHSMRHMQGCIFSQRCWFNFSTAFVLHQKDTFF